ncbi:hypothetical protein R6Q59_015874 [Mikania micrantha]
MAWYTDRRWMYDKIDNNGFLNSEYCDNVDLFLDFAFANDAVVDTRNEKLNEIIKEILKEKEEEKERLNGIIAELEAEKEKHKEEKEAMSNRMSKIEDMLKTLVQK